MSTGSSSFPFKGHIHSLMMSPFLLITMPPSRLNIIDIIGLQKRQKYDLFRTRKIHGLVDLTEAMEITRSQPFRTPSHHMLGGWSPCLWLNIFLEGKFCIYLFNWSRFPFLRHIPSYFGTSPSIQSSEWALSAMIIVSCWLVQSGVNETKWLAGRGQMCRAFDTVPSFLS